MEEQIVFVDERGEPTGDVAPKLASHHAKTRLHLAFSCYVFNEQGKLLVTQRAHTKKVWPGVWTNSVCGHPAPGESLITAVQRRLEFELGMTATDYQVVLPTYRYRTPTYKGIIENEFCPVFVARTSMQPRPNPEEVSSIRWDSWSDFLAETANDSDDYSMFAKPDAELSSADGPTYSWWCKDQLKALKNHPLVEQYAQPISV